MLSVNVSNSNTNVDWFVEETLTLLAETRRNSCKVIVSSDFDLYIVDESYFRNGLFFLSNKMLWCTSKTHKNDTLTVWFVSPQILSLCFLKETLYNFYQIFFLVENYHTPFYWEEYALACHTQNVSTYSFSGLLQVPVAHANFFGILSWTIALIPHSMLTELKSHKR